MQRVLQRYKDLQDIIAILGMDELFPEDKLTVYGPRLQGLEGKHDDVPEGNFFMKGAIEEIQQEEA